MRSNNKDKWAVAIKEELKSMEENGVWKVNLPSTHRSATNRTRTTQLVGI